MADPITHQASEKFVSFEAYVEALSNYRKLLSSTKKTSSYGSSAYGSKMTDATNIPASPEEIAQAKTEFDQISEQFTRQNGEVTNVYVCSGSHTSTLTCEHPAKHIFSGKKTRFFTQYELGKNPEMERVLVEIDYLAVEAARLLRGENLNRCLKLIYKTAKNTMVLIDGVNYHNQDDNYDEAKIAETVQVIQHNLNHAKKFHAQVAKFTAQADYLLGNVIGFVGLISLLVIIALARDLSWSDLYDALSGESLKVSSLLYFGIISGCIGAIISVMNRVSSGDLNLNFDPDARTIRTIGMLRPLIGGVFGAILLILFNSGLSIFSLSGDSVDKVASNLILLGFIAGFFERFVPDILDQTKSKLTAEQAEVTVPSPTS